MDIKQEFDLIASIAIYHFADILFKPQARKALRKAQKAGLLPKGKLNEIAVEVCDRYNQLFSAIVKEANPTWVTVIDRYGAKGFRNEEGIVFTGDDSGFYPWYETAELILERIA